jgi:hypothetical protein
MRHTLRILAWAGCAAVLLAGCYDEGPTVGLHEPGKYLGPKDPLLETAKSAQHEEVLAQRFKTVQTDR